MQNSKTYKLYKSGKLWVISAVAVAGVAVSANTTQVSADTVSNADTQAVKNTDTKQDDKQVQLQSASSTSSTDTKATTDNQTAVKSDVPTTVAQNATPDEAKKTIDSAQDTVKKNAETAKQSGVAVTQGDTQSVTLNKDNTTSKSNEILSNLNKQDEAVKQATATQQANEKAYQDATTNRDDVTKAGNAKLDDANAKQKQAVDDATKSGVKVNSDTTTISPAYKDTKGLSGNALLAVQAYNADLAQKAYDEAVASTDKSTAEIQAIKAENDRIQAEYRANKARVEKANADKKAAHDKEEQAFMTGTNHKTVMEARTSTDMDNGQYKTFMTADVNQATGEFTLKHDMNDGVSIIGRGELKGKILYTVTSNGDGTENFHVTGIELYSYTYNNLNVNTAVNKNINFHVYDFNGNELYSRYHDGQSSFSDTINKQFVLDKTFKLTPNQQSELFKFLKIDDNWIWNTHGDVWVAFQNTNSEPKLPDYEKVPTQPKMLMVTAHQFTVITMPAPETPEQQKVSVHFYDVSVEPEPVQPKEETPKPATPAPTSTPKAVETASILPTTHANDNQGGVLLSALAGLTSLGLLGAISKKFKKQN